MTDGFAWLIEAPGGNYLWAREVCHQATFAWTRDPYKALRFISREQADVVMMAVRSLAPERGAFAVNLGEAWPREHAWLDAQPNTTKPAMDREPEGEGT